MLHDQLHKKIPGILPKFKEGQLDDLSTYSIQQLKELIIRQEKIISNKKFVSKLPDKGEKLFHKLSELKREYSERRDVSKLTEDVKKLSLSHEEAVVNVEWTRETKLGLDSSPNCEENKLEEEKYIGLLLAKVRKDETKGVFKPHRSTIRSQTDETLQLLSLQESFVLQKQQAAKLKEAEVKQASERLLRQISSQDAGASASSSSVMQFLDYRDRRQDDEDHDDDDN